MRNLNVVLLLSIFTMVTGAFSSCSSDDDSPKFNDVTLVAGSSQSLTLGKDLEWKSGNDLIASVTNGEIVAKRVGEVRIVSTKGTFKVNVTPRYSYFDEPCLAFGSTIQGVKNEMKSYTLKSEDDEKLLYKGVGYTKGILYVFENSALEFSYILTSASYSKQVANWTGERYVPLTFGDDYIGMISVDKTIVIIIMPMNIGNSWYYAIGYGKNDKNSTDVKASRATAIIKDHIKKCILDSDVFLEKGRGDLGNGKTGVEERL